MTGQEQDNERTQNTKRVTFLSIFNDFAEKTTAHGIPRIILNRGILLKLLWSLLVSVAFVIFCIQMSSLLSDYYTYRTNLELVNSEYVEFPAVTICNFNRMKRSKLAESSRYQDVLELENKDFWTDLFGDLNNYDWLFSSDNWWDDFQLSPSISDFLSNFSIPDSEGVQWPKSSDSSSNNNADIHEGSNEIRDKRWIFSSESFQNLVSLWDFSSEINWDGFIDLFDKLGDDFASKILEEMAPTKEELRTMGHQAEDFIVQCHFNKAKCDYKNFTTTQNKQYGNCFTFNLTHEGPRGGKITKVGSDYGLHLTLFIEKPQYVGLFTEESGARLAIHPKNIMPHPEDVGISVSPGFATSIGLRQVELKRLGGRYGICTDEKTKNHLNSDKYDYSIISCQKKCLLDHMKEKCGCVNNIYDDYASVPNCKDNGTHENPVRCQQQTEMSFHANKIKCDCPAPCQEYIYNTKLSTALWPSETYEPHLKDKLQAENVASYRTLESSDISRENLVRVKIYFEELNYELVEQVPANTVAEVLGTIGGLLGLCMGFSVITIFEVVILCFRLTKRAIRKAIPNRVETMSAPGMKSNIGLNNI